MKNIFSNNTKTNGFLGYIAVSLCALFYSPAVLLLMFLVPLLLLVKVTKENAVISVPLVLAGSSVLFIVFICLLNLLGIPLTIVNVGIGNMILGITFLVLSLKKVTLPHITLPKYESDKIFIGGVYFLFLIAIITRVMSTRGIEAPILHDPIAHAYWAQSIVLLKEINYFYSPGLHIMAAFLSEATNLTVPLSVHYITNFLSAFSIITWSIIVYLLTKNKWAMILCGLALFFAPYPAILYLTAGKNALVAAIAFLPLAFLSADYYIRKKSLLAGILVVVNLMGIFLLHYPVFVYALLFTILYFGGYVAKAALNKNIEIKTIVGVLLIMVSTALLCGSWLYLQKTAYNNQVQNSVQSSEYQPKVPTISQKKLRADFKLTYKEFKGTVDKVNDYYFPAFLLLMVLYSLFARNDRHKYLITSFTISVLLLPYIVTVSGINNLNTTGDTGILLIFQLMSIVFAYAGGILLNRLNPNTIIKFSVLIFILVYILKFSIDQYRVFRTQSLKLGVLNAYDIEAFNWLEANSNPDDKIIVNAAVNPSRKQIVFPSDGGMWLPVYLKNTVSASFLEFNSQRVHDNFKLYSQISDSNNGILALNKFKEKGYCYYYFDKGVYGPELQFDPLVASGQAKIVHANSEVIIYSFCP